MDLFKLVEDDAIKTFGEDRIGTKELRIALQEDDKKKLFDWMVQRYFQYMLRGF